MADPRLSQSASRLSEDIGDVLSAIRRMIAEDEALTSTRDKLRAERDALDSLIQSDTIHEDAGAFLARRYGGNSALARKLAGDSDPAPQPTEEGSPLGNNANAPDAARTRRVLRHHEIDVKADEAPAFDAPATAANDTSPLRLEQKVGQADKATGVMSKGNGWRSWIRAEPRKSLDNDAQQAIEVTPQPESQEFEALVEEDADFAEAFDWKSRMRPEMPVAKPVTLADMQPPEAQIEETIEKSAPTTAAPDTDAQLQDVPNGFDADDPTLHALLRQMIHEELEGELGRRFSGNLHAVIRREVATMIDQHLERL